MKEDNLSSQNEFVLSELNLTVSMMKAILPEQPLEVMKFGKLRHPIEEFVICRSSKDDDAL